MEAMVTLGSGIQTGTSLLHPREQRGCVFSRDGLTARKSSASFLVCGRFCWEHQQRIAAPDGTKRSKNVILERRTPRASIPVFGSLDAVDTEHPKPAMLTMATCGKYNRYVHHICRCQQTDEETVQEEAAEDLGETWGVQIAIAALKFYKREISSLLPGSCRYVPTCSEYSMQAYKTYGVLKGTVLTACRLARCNPLGGSGFDPPRWFGENKPTES